MSKEKNSHPIKKKHIWSMVQYKLSIHKSQQQKSAVHIITWQLRCQFKVGKCKILIKKYQKEKVHTQWKMQTADSTRKREKFYRRKPTNKTNKKTHSLPLCQGHAHTHQNQKQQIPVFTHNQVIPPVSFHVVKINTVQNVKHQERIKLNNTIKQHTHLNLFVCGIKWQKAKRSVKM